MLDRGGGAMIFISSFVGTSAGIPGMAAYGASKAALMGLVKGVTADYAAQGVTGDRYGRTSQGAPRRAELAARRSGFYAASGESICMARINAGRRLIRAR